MLTIDYTRRTIKGTYLEQHDEDTQGQIVHVGEAYGSSPHSHVRFLNAVDYYINEAGTHQIEPVTA